MTGFALLAICIALAAGQDCGKAPTQQLRIKVDDDFILYENGENILDTIAMPGSQWKRIDDVTFNADVLVIKAVNTGGPGGILLTANGEGIPADQWKCASLVSANTQPEDAYPGVLSSDFDDSAWDIANVINHDVWGESEGFDSSVLRVWGHVQSNIVVCRTKFEVVECPPTQQLRITVDDDFTLYENGENILDTIAMPGSQWKRIDDVTFNADVLVIKAVNTGGPGGILLTANGEGIPADQWKCASLRSANTHPEDAYPGVLSSDFDDSAWDIANVITHVWGEREGFDSSVLRVWGHAQSNIVVCRTKFEVVES